MRSKKEVKEQKRKDIEFLVSAITNELSDLAYLKYFDTWENNGGMGWFFSECVEITYEVMFSENSAYLKWLDHWKVTADDEVMGFEEYTNTNCFDWYHMNKAKEEFESRYTEDECSKEQIGEAIGCLMNDFKSPEDLAEVMGIATKHFEKQRKRDKDNLNKAKIDELIGKLKAMELNQDNIDYLIKRVGQIN